MRFLPSVVASATMLHVVNGIEPCLRLQYQTQLLGILRIDKVSTLSLIFNFLYHLISSQV